MTEPNSVSARVAELAEEFVDRHRLGQRPSLREYIERHPELAEEIRDVFPAMAMMENLALDDETPVNAPAACASALRGPSQEQLGDYRILREVGHGGMGVVYEAEQVSLGRHVALKVLPPRTLREPNERRRFERETKAAARLHHTNIVPVFGVGEHDGTPYFAMQFIAGLGLDAVLVELRRLRGLAAGDATAVTDESEDGTGGEVTASRFAQSLLTGRFAMPIANQTEPAVVDFPKPVDNRPVSDPHQFSSSSATLLKQGSEDSSWPGRSRRPACYQGVARIGAQVADTLAYAHSQGVLHRDIKPSNLLLDSRGTVWVTDFGLAKLDDQQNLTGTGDILGTPRYMPPEAIDGRHDARGDLYSLGLTLYELLAFRPAFDEKD